MTEIRTEYVKRNQQGQTVTSTKGTIELQLLSQPLCPFMSSIDSDNHFKPVSCFEGDCALWDPIHGHCSFAKNRLPSGGRN